MDAQRCIKDNVFMFMWIKVSLLPVRVESDVFIMVYGQSRL